MRADGHANQAARSHILGRNESRKDVPHPIHEVAPHASEIVMLDEPPPQHSVTDAPNPHSCTMYALALQVRPQIDDCRIQSWECRPTPMPVSHHFPRAV
jgi:hypothetical protein